MLAQASRETSTPPNAGKRRGQPDLWRNWLPLAIGLPLVLVAWLIPSLAPIAAILLPLVGLAFAVARLLGRTGGSRSVLRGFLLIWVAISASVAVLVAIGGFYREDLVLLAVVLAVLAVLWTGDRSLSRTRQ